MEGRTETVFSAQKLPKKFFEDLLLSHNVACVIDMTPGDGTLASCCIDTRTPCLCLGVTEEHCDQLEQKMTQYCLTKFTVAGHTLFRDDASKYLDGNGEFRNDTPAESDRKPASSEKNKNQKKRKRPRRALRAQTKKVKRRRPRRRKPRRESDPSPRAPRQMSSGSEHLRGWSRGTFEFGLSGRVFLTPVSCSSLHQF